MTQESIIYEQNNVNTDTSAILQNFFDYLPSKPYCTNTLGSLTIRPKSSAAKNVYVQANPIHRTYWLIFDLDYPARKYWYDENAPIPNISVGNVKNDHQHLFYLLDPAIFTLQNARKKPLELAADVDRGLTELLKADPSYGKLISKNPLHPQWETHIWHEREWTLSELIDYIPRSLLKRKRKACEEIGLGRNCTVFERVRFHAYSEWRRLKFADYGGLFENVFKIALDFNADFVCPMTIPEVRSITRSVCRWTSRHLTDSGFSDWCSRRGKIGNVKSQTTQKTRRQERAERIIAFKELHPDMSNRMIAKVLDIPETTVRRLLRF